MKSILLLCSLMAIVLLLSSCRDDSPVLQLDRNFDRNSVTKDFEDWYKYSYYQIKLSEDFIALDIDSVKIEKEFFLQKLVSDNVIAFNIGSIAEQPVFRLVTLNTNDETISQVSKQGALAALKNFKMEGQPFPTLKLTDINDNVYDSMKRRDKFIVYKCWFIGCTACVAEFPELNKLVEQYTGNKDVLFISLAMDEKEQLKKFLSTRTFEYSTIPLMRNLMLDDLQINSFPTHIVVGGDGRIKKVVGTAAELIAFLEKEIKPVKQ